MLKVYAVTMLKVINTKEINHAQGSDSHRSNGH